MTDRLTIAEVIGDNPSALLRFWKRAAERHLARAESAEQRVATLEAENARLREALTMISRVDLTFLEECRDIALAALKGETK